MKILMTLWLLSGHVVQRTVSADVCAAVAKALLDHKPVVVTLDDFSHPIGQAWQVQCEAPAEDLRS